MSTPDAIDLSRAFLLERFDEFLSLEQGSSARTNEAYGRDLARLAAWAVTKGVRAPDGLTPAHLREFVYHLKDLGLAPSSIRRGLSAVRTWFRFLLAEGVVTKDPSERIETQGPPELRLAFRAELERLTIAFVGIVRAIHAAFVSDAMADAEHVAGLVRRGARGADRAQLAHARPLVRIAVARHRPDADALAQRGLAEYEVPARTGPQIDRGDAQHGRIGVSTPLLERLVEQIGREQLARTQAG